MHDVFFDTYAMLEVQAGNPGYAPYRAVPVVTHQMNVYEFIAAIVRTETESRAREQLRLLAPNLIEAETEDLFDAARFRAENAAKRISYVDALGYVLARKNSLRFLTGDKAFKGLDNVEHVP